MMRTKKPGRGSLPGRVSNLDRYYFALLGVSIQ